MGRRALFGDDRSKTISDKLGNTRTASAALLAERGRRNNRQSSEAVERNRFYLNDLAQLVGVDDWDDISDRVGGFDSEADEEEAFTNYRNALVSAAERMFGDHKLVLVERRGRNKFDVFYEVAPERRWEDAEREIMNTINGVGQFEFASTAEFRRSGPYRSAREAVMRHLHWMKRHPDVYGNRSYRMLYDRNLR